MRRKKAKTKDAPRREGYELEVSKPRVIIKTVDGIKMEPYEDLQIDVPSDFVKCKKLHKTKVSHGFVWALLQCNKSSNGLFQPKRQGMRGVLAPIFFLMLGFGIIGEF